MVKTVESTEGTESIEGGAVELRVKNNLQMKKKIHIASVTQREKERGGGGILKAKKKKIRRLPDL